ncbi:dienelactone hydrolase family protein [Rhizobium skierniewicense]|nr:MULTISPECIES: dienelactone hydrolase family protein [Rhizobium]MBD8689738.1 dienelactone hydrolase family protein [Rhizobium sp. CFBP 13644]MBD8693302.1 dienelactone hydrolase family protein [Rhizobium sp. CFBP 13717]MCI9865762.1 dienelactone hydrolase family protein [Rhizobium skierniewicense]
MRLFCCTLVFVLSMCGIGNASPRQQYSVPTSDGQVLIESFGDCNKPACPGVMILSGSRGFESAAYDEIGRVLKAGGLNAYLVHVLSPADLSAIVNAGSASSRMAYYHQRLPKWIASVHRVAAFLTDQPRHGGQVGIIGVSLGAQIASAASVESSKIDALVLVDGGLPSGYSQPIRSLPPLHLIWGSADRTFPLSIGRDLERKAKQLGVPATLNVYQGEPHDFFLKSGNGNAVVALRSAADFLAMYLSR